MSRHYFTSTFLLENEKKIQACRTLGEDKSMQTKQFLLQKYIIITGTKEMSRVSQCSMQ